MIFANGPFGIFRPANRGTSASLVAIAVALLLWCVGQVSAQAPSASTQITLAGNSESKRDELFRIRNLRSAEASRNAVPALSDKDPLVRATAAGAVAFLPPDEAANVLIPLLADKEPFVRKEAAYALGGSRAVRAVLNLIRVLQTDKDTEVKSAAAIALGQIGETTAVDALSRLLGESPKEETEFLRRSVARAIGRIAQIVRSDDRYVVTPENFLPEKFKKPPGGASLERTGGFERAIGVLTSVLTNRNEANDTRREAAFALGAIGGSPAAAALETCKAGDDPYLAEICYEALLKITD